MSAGPTRHRGAPLVYLQDPPTCLKQDEHGHWQTGRPEWLCAVTAGLAAAYARVEATSASTGKAAWMIAAEPPLVIARRTGAVRRRVIREPDPDRGENEP
ncbi:hypothetical protein PsYK624_132160 [Phanerochaete sordida]|uniref:Uncharacterized protein n=1 Tax=Phanerochaete sordida TaxID=48140 RepID=A0A9P3GLL1_9APHY|nr:hypothetical protein PsYK624_132160 [Phanerochaete sordida]